MDTVLLLVISLLCCSVIVHGQAHKDTQITRVRPLSDEEKLQAPPRDSARSIYLVNLIPAPGSSSSSAASPGLIANNEIQAQRDPSRKTPALFLLQPVQDEQPLPDGIYYRPGQGDKEPPPAIQKDISRLHAFILGRTPRARRLTRYQNKETQNVNK